MSTFLLHDAYMIHYRQHYQYTEAGREATSLVTGCMDEDELDDEYTRVELDPMMDFWWLGGEESEVEHELIVWLDRDDGEPVECRSVDGRRVDICEQIESVVERWLGREEEE